MAERSKPSQAPRAEAIRRGKATRLTRVMAAMRAMHGLPDPRSGAEEFSDLDPPDSIQIPNADLDAVRLSFLLYDVARLHRNAYDEFMKPLGINRLQWSVLAELSRCDGMAQTELATLLEAKKAHAGVVVSALENSGWIERRPDPQDGRLKRVFLVPPAHTVIRQMSVLAGQFGSRILGGLSQTERDQLASSLSRIKRQLKG